MSKKKQKKKFNDAIEYDKNLRNEIDKLRKERFFFENIYKKLEKDLEKLRKDISKNLEEAYDNYEQRDLNQEAFENLKAQMIKKETEYTNILSGIANEMNIRNTRKKAQEKKELKSFQLIEDNSMINKKYSRKLKTEQIAQQHQSLEDKYQKINIVGFTDGYVKVEVALKDIVKSKSDVLFVALGSPKQEEFIIKNKKALENVKIIMPVGGSFDVISGYSKRSPKIFIKLHLEWLYRMLKEPKRIKQNMGIIKFLWLVIFKNNWYNEKSKGVNK